MWLSGRDLTQKVCLVVGGVRVIVVIKAPEITYSIFNNQTLCSEFSNLLKGQTKATLYLLPNGPFTQDVFLHLKTTELRSVK